MALKSSGAIIAATTDNMPGDVTSTVFELPKKPAPWSIQADWDAAGAHVGVIGLEVSNDESIWDAVQLSTGGTTVAVAASTAGSLTVDMPGSGVKFGRVKYTRTSGDGILNARVNMKDHV